MDNQGAGCIQTIVSLIIVLIIATFTGGTFRTEVSFTPRGTEDLTFQDDFKENLTAHHWLGGLIKGEQPDLQNVLAKYERDSSQISSIKIVTRHSATNLLVTFVTLFIYCPETVTVEGVVKQPPEPTINN